MLLNACLAQTGSPDRLESRGPVVGIPSSSRKRVFRQPGPAWDHERTLQNTGQLQSMRTFGRTPTPDPDALRRTFAFRYSVLDPGSGRLPLWCGRLGGLAHVAAFATGAFNATSRKSLMRIHRLVCLAAALLVCSVMRAGAAPPADFDGNSAERYLNMTGNPANLHSMTAGPDGVKALTTNFMLNIPRRTGPPFTDPNDWRTHAEYCAAEVIVLAKNVASSSILTSGKNRIYTVSHFQVLDTIKTDALIKVGQTIVTYREGGQVEDEGEQLRVETSNTPSYQANKVYILTLTRDHSASKLQYIAPSNGTIAVKEERIYPSLGTWAGLLSGTSYSDVKSAFTRVGNAAACH
jgi:hypothetical protein